MGQYKKDLAAADIVYKDELGRVADFHALRHTLQTNMAEADVPLLMQKEIMRHSEIRLTTNVYTHIQQSHLANAVKKLPKFGMAHVNAPENAPNSGKSCLDVTSPVHEGGKVESKNYQCLTGDCLELSSPVASCPTGKLAEGVGFEPTLGLLPSLISSQTMRSISSINTRIS